MLYLPHLEPVEAPDTITKLHNHIMKIYNTTRAQLDEALARINAKHYDGNVIYNHEPEARGNALQFTIRVRDSRAKGARTGHTGRRTTSACWHAHGNLFDAVLELAPDARIVTGATSITRDGGNWEDRNIGSMIQPLYFSEACECSGY